MTDTDVTVADKALLALVGTGLDPVGRRLAEDLVKAMPQAELDAVFLALPILDGLVRREIHTRARVAEAASMCGAQSSMGPRCELAAGHGGVHDAPVSTPAGDLGRVRWR